MSEQLASVEKHHALALEATSNHLDEVWDQVQDSLLAEFAAIRSELSQNLDMRRLVSHLPPPRLLADSHPPAVRFDEAVAFLRSLDAGGVDTGVDNPEAARSYLETHLRRLARTLDITPPPGNTRRALELGAYMQITPALACLLGYEEVRGGYLGPSDRNPVRKTASIGQKRVFTCDIDLFDAEKDPFPYPDSYFDVVLACEILEHLRFDPIHMLLDLRQCSLRMACWS